MDGNILSAIRQIHEIKFTYNRMWASAYKNTQVSSSICCIDILLFPYQAIYLDYTHICTGDRYDALLTIVLTRIHDSVEYVSTVANI